MRRDRWTVSEAARLTRVSVRTLHHYDEIGLLRPSERSAANYRLYTSADLERLHQILVFRDLGFPLTEIGRIMAAPDFDRLEALRAQREVLFERAQRNAAMLAAVDAALRAAGKGTTMSETELGGLFDGFDPTEHEPEARERWGDTAAFRQSQERTRRYTKADWERMKAEMGEVTARYLALMDAGVPPESPRAAEVAEAHRAHIDKWFYDCPPEMFAGLSDLWVNDPRFTRNIDKARPGLAAYQHAAVQAWARTHV